MSKISPYVFVQWLDDNGDPLAGGKLYTYAAGTSTPKATYTDSGGLTANANPVILDAAGRADIWLDTGAYKFTLNTAADVLVQTVDNIVGESVNVFGNTVNSISSGESVAISDKGALYECTAALTLSLLAVATAGEGFVFSVTNTGAGVVTIDPDGAETIGGASTYAVAAGASVMVVCDGAAWLPIFANNFNVTDQPSGTLALTDELVFGDVSAASVNKKDTYQALVDLIPAASETVSGVVEAATTAEMTAGTADKFPDAAKVKAYTDNLSGVPVLLETKTASSSATIDFTSSNIDSTYGKYEIRIKNLVPATDNTGLRMLTSADGGSTFDGGASDYKWASMGAFSNAAGGNVGGDSDTHMELCYESTTNMIGTSTGEGCSGVVTIHDPSDATLYKKFEWDVAYITSGVLFVRLSGGGSRVAVAAINDVQFSMSSGNIASGVFELWGIP